MMIATPLIFLRGLNDPFNVPKLAFATTAVFLVAAIRVVEALQGRSLESFRRFLFPSLAVAIPLLLSWSFSSFRGWALFGQYQNFQGLIPYLVAIVFGALVADAFGGRADRIVWGLALAGWVTGAYALLQSFGLDPFPWNFTAGDDPLAIAALGNENFAGAFLAMSLPALAGAALLFPERRNTYLVGVAVAAAALFLTRSQAPWAGALAGLAVAGTFYVSPRWSWTRLVGVVLAGIIAATVVASVLVTILAPDSRAAAYPTLRVRGDWWEAAADMALDSPVVGHGPNTFSVLGVQYRPPEDAVADDYAFSNDPHSMLFDLLSGSGFPAALGFIAIAIWAAIVALRYRGDPFIPGLLLGIFTAYFVSSLVSIDQISLRMAAWGALGGLAAATTSVDGKRGRTQRSRSKQKPRQRPLRYPLAVGVAGVAALTVFVASIAFVVADARVRRATHLFQERAFERGQTEFESALAIREDPEYRRLYGFWTGEVAEASQPDDGNDGRPRDERETAEADSIAYFRELPEIFGYLDRLPDMLGIRAYAGYLQSWSRTDPSVRDELLEVFSRALELDPLNPRLRADYGDVLIEVGRSEDAVAILEPAAELLERDFKHVEAPDRTIREVFGRLALANAHLGNVEEARRAAERALEAGSSREADEALELIGPTP